MADRFTDEAWDMFSEQVRYKLRKGQQDYGDESFDTPADKLISEIEDEMLDVVGWTFMLHARLEKLREEIVRLEKQRSQGYPQQGGATAGTGNRHGEQRSEPDREGYAERVREPSDGGIPGAGCG